jgi:hypothetical protein
MGELAVGCTGWGRSCTPAPEAKVFHCNFSGQNLPGDDFTNGDLSSANFIGSNFTEADLSGARLNEDSANLRSPRNG